MAAAPELPDLDALTLERVQLQRQLRDLDRQQARLEDRIVAFPNEVSAAQARRLAAEIKAVADRIDEIDATLIPYRLSQ
ncbi:MAG: hypothetical protein ACXVRJ_05000 [Gaiellaceae bacterium]